MNTVLPLLESPTRPFQLPESARAGLTTTPFGLYVHVPFCATRCGYCDFNTYTSDELGPGANRAEYAGTAIAELRRAAETLGPDLPTVSTVFVGGGTPTLLPADDLAAVLAAARDLFPVADDVEVTTEANPESVTPASLSRLREAGFTRISLGMQSAAEHVLAVLDRRHTPGRAVEAAHEARAAGFDHVNLDLIYGAPGETDADWAASLDAVLASPVDHVSAYALIVEDGTRLARRISRGELPMPDDDVLADRYETGRRDAAVGRVRLVRGLQLGDVRRRRAAGTTSSTGPTPTGGASARARTATSAGCAGGTSSTRPPTPTGCRPVRARRRTPNCWTTPTGRWRRSCSGCVCGRGCP